MKERKTTLTYLSYAHGEPKVLFVRTILKVSHNPASWRTTSTSMLHRFKLRLTEKHETKYIWLDCDSHRHGRLGMNRGLDDNMVVDCGEGEKSPTTTCQHTTKPLTAQKEKEK